MGLFNSSRILISIVKNQWSFSNQVPQRGAFLHFFKVEKVFFAVLLWTNKFEMHIMGKKGLSSCSFLYNVTFFSAAHPELALRLA